MGDSACDFPPFKRVHAFARRWQIQGLLTELHDRLRDRVRQKEGRAVDPSAGIVDSQSLRAGANIPRSTSGWDGGKKVAGRKRHLVVDCLGLVLAVMVTAASVQDRDAAVTLLERLRRLSAAPTRQLTSTEARVTGTGVCRTASQRSALLCCHSVHERFHAPKPLPGATTPLVSLPVISNGSPGRTCP